MCERGIDRLDTWLRQIPDTYALLPSVVEHGTVAVSPAGSGRNALTRPHPSG